VVRFGDHGAAPTVESAAELPMDESMSGATDPPTVVRVAHVRRRFGANDEAEGLADKVVVLEDGADLLSGTPVELTRRFWPGTVVRLAAEDPSTLARAGQVPGVRSLEVDVHGVATVQLDDERRVPDLVLALAASGVRLTRVEPHQPTLEDLYFAVRTKRDVADDGGRQLDFDRAQGADRQHTGAAPVEASR